MGMPQLIEAYVSGVGVLRQAVAGMSREQALSRPIPGKWSTLEVVSHLCDFDLVYADRMKRIIAEDRPILLNADEQRYASNLAYQERDLGEEVALLASIRQHLARILHTRPPQVLTRTAILRRDGQDETLTLEQFLSRITNHIPHHVKFIVEKRRALGLPV
jgi:hypothetical protein